jgi:hypothetical protein
MSKRFLVIGAASLVLSVLVALTFVVVATVNAMAPIQQVFDVDDTHPAPGLSAACGFPVLIHEQGWIRDRFHTDNAGNFVMESLTFEHYRVSVINAQSGVTYASPQTGLIKFTPTFTSSSGVITNFVVPGGGKVLIDAGRFVVDADGNLSFEVGIHEYLEGDFQALCAALATP